MARAGSASCDTTRISERASDGSALMRLISAAPRGVVANARSSATIAGRRFMMVSSARSASPSVNARSSPPSRAARSFSGGSSSAAAINTVHEFRHGAVRKYGRRAAATSGP